MCWFVEWKAHLPAQATEQRLGLPQAARPAFVRLHNQTLLASLLSPKTNVLLIFIWASATVCLLLFVKPQIPVLLAISGGVLGGLCGSCNTLVLNKPQMVFKPPH